MSGFKLRIYEWKGKNDVLFYLKKKIKNKCIAYENIRRLFYIETDKYY